METTRHRRHTRSKPSSDDRPLLREEVAVSLSQKRRTPEPKARGRTHTMWHGLPSKDEFVFMFPFSHFKKIPLGFLDQLRRQWGENTFCHRLIEEVVKLH